MIREYKEQSLSFIRQMFDFQKEVLLRDIKDKTKNENIKEFCTQSDSYIHEMLWTISDKNNQENIFLFCKNNDLYNEDFKNYRDLVNNHNLKDMASY